MLGLAFGVWSDGDGERIAGASETVGTGDIAAFVGASVTASVGASDGSPVDGWSPTGDDSFVGDGAEVGESETSGGAVGGRDIDGAAVSRGWPASLMERVNDKSPESGNPEIVL